VHAPEPCVDNIAFSARDAMPECGTLTIDAANAHMDKTCAATIAARFLNPTHLIRALVADRPT